MQEIGNNMSRLFFTDESLNPESTEDYILSILISSDEFSFSIMDSENRKIIALFYQYIFSKEPEFQLKKIKTVYDEIDLLNQTYLNTRIFFRTPQKTTLVPNDAYVPYLIEDFFKLAHIPSSNGKVLSSFVPTFNSYAVYEINGPVIDFICEKHQHANLYNDLVASAYNIDLQHPFLKVTILREQVVILAVSEGNTFYNSYYYEGENDLLYYTIGAVKNLNLETDTIYLEGIINNRESIFYRFKQYFNTLKIVNTEARLAGPLQHLPDSRFVTLFNSLLL